MAPPRKFDWEEARALHESGHGYAEIGRRLGVTDDAVRRVLDDVRRESTAESALDTMRRKRSSGEYRRHDLAICPRCQGPKSRRGQICRECRAKERGAPPSA